MSRHVISVCIFCFICATHSPCASHAATKHENVLQQKQYHDPASLPSLDNTQSTAREKIKETPIVVDKTNNNNHRIVPRNSDSSNSYKSDNTNDDEYVRKIFSIYGDGESMTIDGFERLIGQLRLQGITLNNANMRHDKNDVEDSQNGTQGPNNSCINKEGLASLIKRQTKDDAINDTQFYKACPILLYSILAQNCANKDIQGNHQEESTVTDSNGLIWLCSIVAVIIISACGVLALAIIPVMQKRFYKPMIQFLVALAVGTLAGDALLHLLPHAMTADHGHTHHGHDHSHDENTTKGCVAMLGLTFFFIMERLISLFAKWRKGKQKPKHSHHVNSSSKSRSPTLEKLEANQNMIECPGDLNATEANKMLKPSNDHHKHEDYTIILREHKNEHHGHSHKHVHVHSAPENFSSVAWMVIMGDGLHNFTDGMAIGAAFSGGLAGGFSTTVAVFCHELPHELGDFAMLLKAGMSIKQALFYNILSSVLCVFGNIFGLALGNTEYASSWVFAAAAGMFIYIALVDMIPELSSAHEDEGNLLQCALHLGGLLLGFGIMALIAFYEHDLKHIFHDQE